MSGLWLLHDKDKNNFGKTKFYTVNILKKRQKKTCFVEAGRFKVLCLVTQAK